MQVVRQLQTPVVVTQVFLRIRQLEDEVRPVHVWRYNGMTLVTADPRSTRLEVTDYCVDHLTEQERRGFLAGFGIDGNVGPDWTTEDVPAFLYVPPGLRLTGDAPLQGGAELRRRYAAGEIAEEIEAYLAETETSAETA